MEKAIKDSRDFFKDLEEMYENHKKSYGSMQGYTAAVDRTSIEPGRKIYLELDVTNKYMSGYLFSWLHQKDENKLPLEVFGCVLQSIHFEAPGFSDKKDQLIEFINNL